MSHFSYSFFTSGVPVPNQKQKIEFLRKFLCIFGYNSSIFKHFLDLYRIKRLQLPQNQPDFLEWFCGSYLSELSFILKNKCEQQGSLSVMETLSQLICEPTNLGSIFRLHTEEVMVKSWQHQHDPNFNYPSVSGIDETGIPLYD